MTHKEIRLFVLIKKEPWCHGPPKVSKTTIPVFLYGSVGFHTIAEYGILFKAHTPRAHSLPVHYPMTLS